MFSHPNHDHQHRKKHRPHRGEPVRITLYPARPAVDIGLRADTGALPAHKAVTLDGKSVEINIPAGTQVDSVLKVSGQGLPNLSRPSIRGNLYVRLGVIIPKKTTAVEKELLTKLDSEAGKKSNVKSKKGFFK